MRTRNLNTCRAADANRSFGRLRGTTGKAVCARLAISLTLALVLTEAQGQSSPTEPTADAIEGLIPAGVPVQVATGLTIPWSGVPVGDEVLVSQRGIGEIIAIRPGERPRSVGEVSEVVARGDGGMLGLAVLERGTERWLYAYHSTASGNRIVRLPYSGGRLGGVEIILDGLPGGRGHNGGRIAFGPDGMLYVTTGETRNPALSQDLRSLAGKILRMTPEGKIPDDNPIPGSFVYSSGHRNPQGLAWDQNGQLWSTEFGEDTWDELNRIEPGGNYGWPLAEGRAGNPRFIDPVVQWPTQEMGPSGLAFIQGTFFIAGLTGERLWTVSIEEGGKAKSEAFYTGEYGRIRDVFEGVDGKLWFLTNGSRDQPAGQLRSVGLSPGGASQCTLDLETGRAC